MIGLRGAQANDQCSKCGERARSGKNRWCSVCIGASRKRPANAKAQTERLSANGHPAANGHAGWCVDCESCLDEIARMQDAIDKHDALCAGKDATIATLTKGLATAEGETVRLRGKIREMLPPRVDVGTLALSPAEVFLPIQPRAKPEKVVAPYRSPYSSRIYDRSIRG